MTAEQMYNEYEIAYEEIASGNAPGYQPYEVSILLTQAQDIILKALIASGVEYDDTKGLVLGPHIKTDPYTESGSSSVYSDTFTIEVDSSPYWGIVNERLRETSEGNTIEVRPIDHSFYSANIDNPYKKPDATRYFWRMIEAGTVSNWLIVGPDTIDTYYINYVEKPNPIIVPGVNSSVTIDGTEIDSTVSVDGLDCAYNSIIHRDIIIKAAQLGKAFIGDSQGLQLLSTSK